ncbi:MAG: membrane protein insertion efficiency factor YidD [Candidatus Riflebacteria bacterium]|nr:membrane protein insertion efficiency factor YidD [Candidatus Riflebacteria bacterium]
MGLGGALASTLGQQVTSALLIGLIHRYQAHASPRLRGHVHCLYPLSCSHYAERAITKHGSLSGTALAVLRVMSCNRLVGPRREFEVP